MKAIILIFGLLVLLKSGNSQGFIHLKKDKIKSVFLKHCEKDSLDCTISELNSTLILSVRDASVLPVDYFCYFNKKGKCIEEITKLCCDSCSEGLVRLWLESKRFRWHSIDSRSYISGMGKNLAFNIIDSTSFSVRYLRPREYVLLRGKYKEAKRRNKE